MRDGHFGFYIRQQVNIKPLARPGFLRMYHTYLCLKARKRAFVLVFLFNHILIESNSGSGMLRIDLALSDSSSMCGVW